MSIKGIVVSKFITRADVQKHRDDRVYLFGDNLERKGFGGQAKEMRGEPNSIGIPTKKSPNNNPGSFFTDEEYDDNVKSIDEAFKNIPVDKIVVIPSNGIGTGLAQLDKKAPKTFRYLQYKLEGLFLETIRGSKE